MDNSLHCTLHVTQHQAKLLLHSREDAQTVGVARRCFLAGETRTETASQREIVLARQSRFVEQMHGVSNHATFFRGDKYLKRPEQLRHRFAVRVIVLDRDNSPGPQQLCRAGEDGGI